MLTGLADPAAAAVALARQCGEAVVKAGRAGAVWSDGLVTRSIPARPAQVIDSTGAGDAFAAGFLAARRRGADVSAGLAAAAELAAVALAQVGARPA